jgi:hypothetical protein
MSSPSPSPLPAGERDGVRGDSPLFHPLYRMREKEDIDSVCIDWHSIKPPLWMGYSIYDLDCHFISINRLSNQVSIEGAVLDGL